MISAFSRGSEVLVGYTNTLASVDGTTDVAGSIIFTAGSTYTAVRGVVSLSSQTQDLNTSLGYYGTIGTEACATATVNVSASFSFDFAFVLDANVTQSTAGGSSFIINTMNTKVVLTGSDLQTTSVLIFDSTGLEVACGDIALTTGIYEQFLTSPLSYTNAGGLVAAEVFHNTNASATGNSSQSDYIGIVFADLNASDASATAIFSLGTCGKSVAVTSFPLTRDTTSNAFLGTSPVTNFALNSTSYIVTINGTNGVLFCEPLSNVLVAKSNSPSSIPTTKPSNGTTSGNPSSGPVTKKNVSGANNVAVGAISMLLSILMMF